MSEHEEKEEQLLGSPEDLDRLMRVTDPLAWTLQWIVMSILTILLLWAFFGVIPITAQGKGVTATPGGIFQVFAPLGGSVQEIMVQQGQFVKKGDPLVQLRSGSLSLSFSLAEAGLKAAEEALAVLEAEVEKEGKEFRQATETALHSAQFKLTTLEAEIPYLMQNLNSRQELYQKGLISLSDSEQAVKALGQQRIAIENTQAEIASLEAQLSKPYRQSEIRSAQERVRKEEENLQQTKYEIGKLMVKAPRDGTILDLLVHLNSPVDRGTTPLFSMEAPLGAGETLQFFSFFPASPDNSPYEVGMPVEISVSGVDSDDYGRILGKVSKITQYSLTEEQVFVKTGRKTLSQSIVSRFPTAVGVVIEPTLDPNTPTGYKWTGGQGPNRSIPAGTYFSAFMIVERRRPISYAMPFLKTVQVEVGKLFGGGK